MTALATDATYLLIAGGIATIASVVMGGRWLRHGLALAGAVAAVDAVVNDRGLSPLLLALLFTAANLLAVIRMRGRAAALSGEARIFHQRHLPGLAQADAKLLIDQGNFIEGRAGEELTHEGAPVQNLYFLVSGVAAVLVDHAIVGKINPGDLIGEACLLGEGRASATVRLAEDRCRLWFIAKDRLNAFLAAQPAIAAELNKATMSALRDKLEAANRVNAG